MNDNIEKNINDYFGEIKLSSVEKGVKFLKWALGYIFDKTDSEIEEDDLEEGVVISRGLNSLGIDAAFVDNIGLHLIQSRYGTSHSSTEVNNFISNVERIVNTKDECVNEVSQRIINSLKKYGNVYFYYITNQDIADEQYRNFSIRISNLEKNFGCINEGKIIILDSDSIDDYVDQNTYNSAIPPKYRQKKLQLLLENWFINKQKDTVIAEVSLKELAGFVGRGKQFLFYSNIRNYLGKNNVNKDISNTYKNYPKDFWFYNNGITIVCDFFENPRTIKNNVAKITMTVPQIVNGCQTASTIYNCWSSDDKEIQKTKEGTILIKIIKDTNNKRKDITRYTNNQTAVTGKDLFALEDFHYKLKNNFKKIGYNYETQRRKKVNSGKGNKIYSYLFYKGFKNSFYAKDIVQAYAAGMYFKPAKARTISNFVPGGPYYDKLFNDSTTPIDPRFYLFPYGILCYSKYTLEYNKKPRFKSTSLLYVTVYFKLLLEIFKKLDLINPETKLFIEDNQSCVIERLDKIFTNEKVNKKLLETADNILRNFLKDSKIKNDKIGDNLPKFLKTTIEADPQVVSILQDKIQDEFEDENIDLQKINEVLKN